MASYKELFMREYASIYEDAGIALETPTFKGAHLTMFSDEAKAAASYSKSGRRYEKQKEYNKALSDYAKARKSYMKLMSEADKIEDEDGWSWLVRLCVMPWWFAIAQVVGSDFDFKSITRKDTKRVIRTSLNAVDNQIMMCKDKMKDSKK